MLQIYVDLIMLHRIHNRLELAGRQIAQDTYVGPLSLRERAGVRDEYTVGPKPNTRPQKRGRHWRPLFRYSYLNQNAGNTAPLYFSVMNFFTSGLCRAAASFFMASLSLLSARDTRMFT